MPMKLTCPAPAKPESVLHVTGRRADGYHLLQTLFRFIDLRDTLHFSLREDGAVHRTNVIEGVAEGSGPVRACGPSVGKARQAASWAWTLWSKSLSRWAAGWVVEVRMRRLR